MSVTVKGSDGDMYLSEQQYRRSVAARFNWHVMYTLLHNPDIRVTHKGYVQMLRYAATSKHQSEEVLFVSWRRKMTKCFPRRTLHNRLYIYFFFFYTENFCS